MIELVFAVLLTTLVLSGVFVSSSLLGYYKVANYAISVVIAVLVLMLLTGLIVMWAAVLGRTL